MSSLFSLDSQAFEFRLNYTAAFLCPHFADDGLWDFLASITAQANSYNKGLLVYLSIYPIFSVSLENLNYYEILSIDSSTG